MANNKETREVEIIVSGKKVDASLKDMEAAAAILNAQLRKLPQNTQDFADKAKELQSVRDKMNSVRESIKGMSDSMNAAEGSAAQLQTKIKALEKEVAGLAPDTDEFIKKTAELQNTKKNFEDVSTKIKGLDKDIIHSKGSFNDLTQQVDKLEKELKALPAGTVAFTEKSKELASVRTRLQNVKQDVNALEKSGPGLLQSLGGAFGNITGIIAGGFIAAITMAVMTVINFGKEAYELAKQYSDAFADIQKSTGLAADQVQKLNDNLGNIDTRTGQKELLDIAKVAGQMGIGTDLINAGAFEEGRKEIEGFTVAVDKAAVALGDEFTGGAEEVAQKLGVLDNLFKGNIIFNDKEGNLSSTGDRLNMIGSAINSLGAAGSANGPFMQDFASRLAGLGQLTPQIDQTLGLGAALQELGETAENAASGTKTVITTAAADIPNFAKQVGLGAKEFQNLINNNPNAVLLKLAESFKGMAPSDVIMRLNALNIKSKESQGVLIKLANNTDFVKKKQELANEELKKATSLTNEFNTKNNTDAAIAEKRAKAWEKFQLQLGQGIAPAISAVQGLLIGLLGIFTDVFGSVGVYFSEFFATLRQMAANLGLSADKGSIFAGVLEVIGTILKVALLPLKLVLTVITALVGAFNYAYEKSALFRSAIEVMLAPLKILWETVKQAYEWIQKLADLGNKDVKVKATVETTTTKKQAGNKPAETYDSGELDKLMDEQAEKERKAAEESAKRAAAVKARREKDAADLLKIQQQYNDDLTKAEQELEALRQAIAERGNVDRIAQLELAHQKQVDALEKRRNEVLNNTKLTEEQKQNLLYKYHQEELLMEDKLAIDKAQIQAEIEEKLQQAENKRDMAKADREIILAGENADKLLRAKLEKLELEKEIELQNKQLTEEEKALIEAEFAQQSEALYNELAEKKKAKEEEIAGAMVQIGQAAISAIGDFTRIGTDKKIEQYDREKSAAVKKLDQQLKEGKLSQDQYNRAKERTEAEYDKKTTEAKRKQAKIDKAVALTNAIIATTLAVVKALPNIPLSIAAGVTGALGIAQIAATPLPTFATGGYTGNGFGSADESGFRPAGVVHENEWVGPRWMVDSPKYANIFSYLEAERTRKNGYAQGGSSSASNLAPLPVAADQTVSIADLVLTITGELQEMKQILEEWPRVLEVHNDVGDTVDKINIRNKLIKDSSL